MDPCVFPFGYFFNLGSLVAVLVFAVPYFPSLLALPSKYRRWGMISGVVVSFMVIFFSARQECQSDVAIGGNHAPTVWPVIADFRNLNAEFVLLIVNDSKIPLREVRLTISKAGRQADGASVIENPFTHGREINVGTVAPQHAPIQLPIKLIAGTYEIKIFTSRRIYSERLSILPNNGELKVEWRVTDENTNKVVRSSDE